MPVESKYAQAIRKDLKREVVRQHQVQLAGVNIDDPADVRAVLPDMPSMGEQVNCIYCGKDLPMTRKEPTPAKVIERERKFKICQQCRSAMVGPGGTLDKNTYGLDRDRKY